MVVIGTGRVGEGKGWSGSIRVRSKLLRGGLVRSWQVQNWSGLVQVGPRLVINGQISSGYNRSYSGMVLVTEKSGLIP